VNGATTKGAETCTVTDTQVTYLDDTVATATETREGENPVTATTESRSYSSNRNREFSQLHRNNLRRCV
jgi:hypothetical protein